MNNKILDELCKQILSSARGISEYIDEMYESQWYQVIDGWEEGLQSIKRNEMDS